MLARMQRKGNPSALPVGIVVAIDNKIEQAMDLVKSYLMYGVREEVEVLKEQIKELIEKNSQVEQENNLLKTLASPEQLASADWLSARDHAATGDHTAPGPASSPISLLAAQEK
uniref:TSC22 domain family protein 1 n=1 Tax=Suricata suricatta TaxID=37032 RepID=A0A673TQC7_SURSU